MRRSLQPSLLLLGATVLLFAVLAVPDAARAAPAETSDAAAEPDIGTSEAPREIGALLSLLRVSDCRFERNGHWYDGPRAADHLQRKLDHAVARRRAIPSAEAFIDGAATRSSFTGRAYHVRCGEAAVLTSAAWFHARLRELRTH